MIIISTNNGKNYVENLLNDLNNLTSCDEITIIDTISTDDSFEYLKTLISKNKYNLKISIIQTPYPGWDTGSIVYAAKNLISDRFYFLHDSIRIKRDDFFKAIDNIMVPGTVVPLIHFPNNLYDNNQQIDFCINNFGTRNYNKGIFGPMFGILKSDMDKIDLDLIPIIKNKNEQMSMERGWAMIFEKYGLNIESLEGNFDHGKLIHDQCTYFHKLFPNRGLK